MAHVPAEVLDKARDQGALVAGMLATTGHAYVEMEPGDATRYKVAVLWLPDHPDDLIVDYLEHGAAALPSRCSDGSPRQWNGAYLEGKLGLIHGNGWAGCVLAAFLEAVAAGLPASSVG